MIEHYGRQFSPIGGKEWGLLAIELLAFREGFTVESGGLGRTQHFINIVKEIWPDFTWYEWAYEQAEALCSHKVTGFTSGASSSKSDLLGKYGLVSWYSNPVNTLVIVCSTSATDAKMRIFGHIIRDHRKARAQNKSVGNLIESQSIIKLSEKTDGEAASDNSSVCLVAAGDQYKDDALKRLEGRKNKNVLLIIDEGQDVSGTIVETALWNLSANPNFEVHMAGNAAKRSDPHGVFMTPIDGWTNVNITTHQWKIRVGGREGLGIHFDATAEDSPNMRRFAQGIPELPFLRKAEDTLSARAHLGPDNPTFMRQFRGFWPLKEGESNYIVTDSELAVHNAYDNLGQGFAWQSAPNDFAGLDPSYSSGGDRFVMAHLQYGLSTAGVWVIYFKEMILIRPAPIKGETKDDAAVRECRRHADERRIPYRNIGSDASAGTAFTSILHRTWSPDIVPVSFGGAASDKQISLFDKRIAKDVYANRTSELAYVLKEFLVAGQVRGVKPDHAKELTSRQYEIAAGNKIKIEPKAEMKKRLGFSPDLADAGAVALDVIRERLKILAGQTGGASGPRVDWSALQKKLDVTGRTEQARKMAFLGH